MCTFISEGAHHFSRLHFIAKHHGLERKGSRTLEHPLLSLHSSCDLHALLGNHGRQTFHTVVIELCCGGPLAKLSANLSSILQRRIYVSLTYVQALRHERGILRNRRSRHLAKPGQTDAKPTPNRLQTGWACRSNPCKSACTLLSYTGTNYITII